MDEAWYDALRVLRELLLLAISIFPPEGEQWLAHLFDKWVEALISQPIPATPEALGQFFGLWIFTLGVTLKVFWVPFQITARLLEPVTEKVKAHKKRSAEAHPEESADA